MGRLSRAQRRRLLNVARESIRAKVVRGQRYSPEKPAEGEDLGERGAFVSLHIDGRLRGCIGTFTGHGPIDETVAEMGVSAAVRDPRFSPLTSRELPQVDIEISVLSPLKVVEDTSEIQVGEHGLYVTKGTRRGVLLPQVAVQYGWDRETFLAETCRKAGLPPDAWKDEETVIEIFSAEVFSEGETYARSTDLGEG